MTFQNTISFDGIDDAGNEVAHISPPTSDVAHFAQLEWQVVALAQRDPLSSIHAPGRFAMAMGWLFGGHTNVNLSDPRLEMLRRMAVEIWHHQKPADAEYSAFLDAGFSEDQLLLLWRSIERHGPIEKTGSFSALLIGLKMAGAVTHMPISIAR